MEKIHFILDGLTCEACTKIVKNRLLKKVEGIQEIEVQKSGEVNIASDSPVTQEMIEGALVDTDFKFVSF